MKSKSIYIYWVLIVLSITGFYSLIYSNFLLDIKLINRLNILHLFLIYFFHLLLGVSLGVYNFYTEYLKKGQWSFNFLKMIILGIPSLILSTTLIAYLPFMPTLPLLVYLSPDGLMVFFRITLGYIIITSFYKKPF